MNDIQTITNPNAPKPESFFNVELNKPRASTYANIPDIKSKTWILYSIIIVMIGFMCFNMFVTYDIYHRVEHIGADINMIKSEQLSRTDKVYNKTKDRFYRQDFKDWLVLFEKYNPEISVPTIPDTSLYGQ
jgi:hypothetical protein